MEAAATDPESVATLGWVIIGLYFIPSILSILRGQAKVGSVVVTNLFLGWTLLGWIVALAMAAGRKN